MVLRMHRLVSMAALAAALVGGTLLGAPAPVHAQTAPAACPADLKIAVAPPTAAAPTTVTATLTPTLNLKAAALGDATSFHVHYYVDIDPTKVLKAGTPIPTGDPKIIHGAALTQDVGTLTAGSHTVWVVVGQVSHQACGGADGNIVAGSTTFTVAAAQAAPAATAAAAAPAPGKTGTGGLQGTSSSGLAPLALLAVAAIVVVGARRVTAR